MDNKTIDQIDDMFQDHKRTVINKVAYGRPAQKLQEAIEEHFNEMVKNLERNLDSSELLTPSTYEFLHSEAPVAFHELGHFAESHSDNAISIFQSASTSAHNATLDVLSENQINRDEQTEEVSGINKRKRAQIEGQKDDDQRRDNYHTREKIKDVISSLVISVQQTAVRNTFAHDIAERLDYFNGLSRDVLQEAVETLGTDFDTHTEEIYAIIQAEMEKHESEVLSIAGLDEMDRQADTQIVNQEPVFTQELADYFASGNVDTSKLSPQECTWYLNYLFDGPLPTITHSNNRDAFKDSPRSETLIDSLPDSILGDSFESIHARNAAAFKDEPESKKLDVSLELQPLPPDVLEEYNRNVAAGRKNIEDRQSNDPDKDDKNIDSLPDLFL